MMRKVLEILMLERFLVNQSFVNPMIPPNFAAFGENEKIPTGLSQISSLFFCSLLT